MKLVACLALARYGLRQSARGRPISPGGMNVNELLALDITDLALGGKALARHEGRVVFVDRGLPGDIVQALVTRVKPRYAEARLQRVETPSSTRIPPRCAHVPACGGCRLQELPYAPQRERKQR